MPDDKPKIPAPSCNPGSVSLTADEAGHGEDANNAFAAFKAAYDQAQKKADALLDKFEAQDCPPGKDGCPFKSVVRDDPVVVPKGPIQKTPVKGKGMAYVCDLSIKWPSTIYCYKKKEDKEAADTNRAKEKLQREEKAKKDGA